MKKFFHFLSLPISMFAYSQDLSFEYFGNGSEMSFSELVHAGDDRIFAVNKLGTIEIFQQTGERNDEPFLDISELLSEGISISEDGLLGLAFHPNYSVNGTFFVFYTDESFNSIVAKYSVSENPNIANPNGNIILTIPATDSALHFGGKIAFDQNGYLWIASGTGSNGLNALSLDNLRGKILRIDVNSETYTIPGDNPFVGVVGAREEIWAYGLRNPWKFSFDFDTNEVWIADVGDMNEEINRQPINQGGIHYGFPCYSGTESYNIEPCESIDPETLTFPIYEYELENGQAVIGGYVFKQNENSPLYRKYIFGDFFGTIGVLNDEGNADYFNLPGNSYITSLGEDVNRQLYYAAISQIYKINDNSLSTDETKKLSFSISRNPTTDSLNISSNKPIDAISIYSAEGKLIQTLNGNATQIDISSYPKGVYLVTIQSGKVTKTQKVIKK